MMRPRITALVLFLLVPSTGLQAAGGVDTSAWACEYCPFENGVSGTSDIGVTNVSDDSAYLGNATGYDEEGAYLNVDAQGSLTRDKHQLRWNIEDLGLDSRVINIDGGEPGVYEYRLDWTELPFRRFFTTDTVFTDVGDATLVLPDDWVRAPTTAGFSALDDNLTPRGIESDRRTLGLGGSYFLRPRLALNADYRQRTNEGVRMTGASTYTNASQLAAPFDHQTDELELSLRYGTDSAYLSLGWFLSDFNNQYEALTWEQPFITGPGAENPQMAQAPDNRFQQFRLSGGYQLPEWRTVLTMSAAFGRIEQDADFLAYTTNTNLNAPALPRSNLAGEVETSQLVVTLNSRPLPKTRLRASYRYDERDNQTPVDLYSRVIADTFLSGEPEPNVPFGYERQKVDVVADWDVLRQVRLSAGMEYKEQDRTLQEVESQDEFLSFGRIRVRPLAGLEIDGRYGNSRREIDNYDEVLALAQGQNPLLRKYNLAYRFREFIDVRASYSLQSLPLSFSVTGVFADDSYTQSQLGLVSGEEQSLTADVSWFISERASLFLNAGIDDIESEQLGSESFGEADWRGTNDDSFSTWGGGFRIDDIAGRVDLSVTAITSRGESSIVMDTEARGVDAFPDIENDLDRLRFDLTYHHSETLELTATAIFQRFQASDWALQGVGPATVPQYFSLGAEPYDDENVILSVGVRYRPANP